MRSILVALVGNAACGKTTLFNLIVKKPVIKEYIPSTYTDVGSIQYWQKQKQIFQMDLLDYPHNDNLKECINMNAIIMFHDGACFAGEELVQKNNPDAVVFHVWNKIDLDSTRKAYYKTMPEFTDFNYQLCLRDDAIYTPSYNNLVNTIVEMFADDIDPTDASDYYCIE
jgi:tRNA A37 threonylcarbamoyladenosine biosynthesis protein TsaE